MTGRNQFLVPFAVQLVPAGMVLIGSVMLKETPRWLFSKGRREKAIKNLCWIRNLEPTDQYIIEEVEMMETANDEIPKGFFQPIKLALTDSKILWRLFLGHMLFVLQNFSGINAIVSVPECPGFQPLPNVLIPLNRTTTLQLSSEPWVSTATTPSIS